MESVGIMSLMRSNQFQPERTDESTVGISWLTDVELFKRLEPTELALFLKELEDRTYLAGSMVFTPEDASCEQLFVLKQGQVDLYRLTTGGKRLVTRRIIPGQVFGVMGLIGRTMQENFAQAITDSVICIITREQVLALLKQRPDFMLSMLEVISNRLRLLEERLMEAAYSPVNVRVAHFLLANADSASGVLTGVTHEEVANTVGAVRQTVTENLSLMRKQGLILTGPKEIRIIDREGLQELIRSSGN